MPDAEEFAITMCVDRMRNDKLSVFYDDTKFPYGKRCWWLLQYFGKE